MSGNGAGGDLLDRDGVDFLPGTRFRFPDCWVSVRSNTDATLDHLASMYHRFLEGSDPPVDGEPRFEIVDRLEDAGELSTQDDRHFYQLKSTRGYDHFTCRNRRSLEIEYVGFCDPMTLLQSSILTTASEAMDGWNLFHAGAVSMAGRGVLLMAGSESGKTTLSLELVRRGCGFLSDEVACLHPEKRRMMPFPRRINLRRDSRALLGLDLGEGDVVSADIEDLFPGTLADPCEPAHLIMLRSFAEEPHLERISRTNLLFEIFRHAIGNLPDRAQVLFRYVPFLRSLECHELVAGGAGVARLPAPDPAAALVDHTPAVHGILRNPPGVPDRRPRQGTELSEVRTDGTDTSP